MSVSHVHINARKSTEYNTHKKSCPHYARTHREQYRVDTDSRQSRGCVWTRAVFTVTGRGPNTAREHGPWTGVICTELKARPCGYRCSCRCVRSCRVETRQLHVWKTTWPMPTGDEPALKTSWPALERSRTVKTKNCSPRPCLSIKPWGSVSHCWFLPRSDVISSSHYASCFPAITWGKLWKMFVVMTSLSSWDSDNTDIFLNQPIQFYSSNATNLHLTPHSTPCCPTA